MSFAETLDNLALTKSALVQRFEDLISPKSDHEVEAIAQASRSLTLQNFGRTMRLFAPLYLPTNASTIAAIAVSRAIIRSCVSPSRWMKWLPKPSISLVKDFGRSFSLPARIPNL